MSFEVLAEQLITTTAVEAGTTELRVVGDDTLTNLEVLDFGTNGGDNTNGLVAGDQRELHHQPTEPKEE